MNLVFRFTTLFLCLTTTIHLNGQCGLTVFAGNDTTICANQLPFPVSGFAEGDGLFGTEWAPEGVFNNVRGNDAQFRGNRDTTVYFSAFTARPEDNLFVNKGFGDRFNGWDSNYAFEPDGAGGEWGPITSAGSYSISNSPQAVHQQFDECRDVDGNNRMMVVNNSGRNNDPILCQTVTVLPGVDYVVSAFISTVRDTNAATLRFAVNRMGIGNDFELPLTTCDFQQYTARWSSGSATTADVCIVNRSDETIGNDIAIDDLYFGPVCVQTDSFRITIPTYEFVLEDEVFLPCVTPEEGIEISAVGSSEGPEYSYRWRTTDGNIVSGGQTLTPMVNEPGTYTFEIIYDDGNGSCSRERSMRVRPNPFQPRVQLQANGILNCTNGTVRITSNGTSPGTRVWSLPDGTTVLNVDRINAVIPGLYSLRVVGGQACIASESIFIEGDFEEPAINIPDPGTLGCGVESLIIDARGSDAGPDIDLQWNVSGGGRILNGRNGYAPEIDRTGSYELILTNSRNGCSSDTTVRIRSLFFGPRFAFDVPQPFTCSRTQINVEATITNVPFGTMLDYAWTTDDGVLVSGLTNPTVRIGRPGTYTLTVTNRANGCMESESVVVDPGIGVPLAVANGLPTITCTNPSVTLDGSGSTTGANYVSSWEDPMGNEVTDLTVTTGGVYTLTVTNTDDGCTSTDNVTVEVDRAAPSTPVSASETLLTCNITEIAIATAVDDPAFTYSWAGPAGGITGPTNGVGIMATEAGTYTLTTTNTANGCTATNSLTLTANQEEPIVSIAEPDLLNCSNPTQVLQGAIANPAGFVLSWTTSGNIVSGGDTPTPTIDAPGNYQLFYENPTTGCFGSATVTVMADLDVVEAVIDGDNVLNCNQSSVVLSPMGSNTGSDITYSWFLGGTEIQRFPGTEVGSIDVTNPGTYELLVENTTTGCNDTESLIVTEDTFIQNAEFSPTADYLLTCTTSEVLLEGAPSEDPSLDYTWTLDGAPFPAASGNSYLTSTAGTFRLTISNSANGCSTFAEQVVTENRNDPAAAVAMPDILNCTNASVFLSETSGEADITYSWSGPSVVAVAPDTRSAEVDGPGTYTLTATNSLNGCTSSSTVEVLENTSVPSSEAGPGVTLDCAIASQTLDGSGSSSGGTIAYLWTGPAITGDPTSLNPEIGGPGRYFLEVTDTENGCIAIDSVEVTADFDAPMIDYARSQVLSCRETLRVLSPVTPVDADWTFSWATDGGVLPPETDREDLTVENPGRYILTVTDPGSGCTTAVTVNVEADVVPPTPVVAAPADLSCSTTTVELDGSGTPDDGSITYFWSTGDGMIMSGATSPTATVSSVGTYQLRTENSANGCTDSITVVVNDDADRPMVALDPNSSLDCRTTSLELATAPATRDDNYVYAWSLVGGNLSVPTDGPTLMVDVAGTYELQVTNTENGCEQLLTTDVSEDTQLPVLTLPASATLTCEATTLSGMATVADGSRNIDYAWATDDGSIVGGMTGAELTVSAPGIYTLVATDTETGCESSGDWIVAEDQRAPIVELPATFDLGCDPAPIRLTPTVDDANDYDFSWTSVGGMILDGADGLSPLIEGGGRYTVSVINPDNACTATGSVVVTQNIIGEVAVDFRSPNCTETDGSLVFGTVTGGQAPYLYSIDGGVNFGMVTDFPNLEPNTYQLVIQDARGCETDTTIVIEAPRDLELMIDRIITIEIGDSVRLGLQTNYSASEIDTVIWSPIEGLSCTDCLQPFARPFRSVAYTVEVRSTDDCSATAGVTVEVDKNLSAYFPTAFSPNGDGRNELFHPFGNLDKIVRVRNFRVHDRWGNAVFEAEEIVPNDIRLGWNGMHRGKPSNAGVYVYTALVEFVGGEAVVYEGEVVLMR